MEEKEKQNPINEQNNITDEQIDYEEQYAELLQDEKEKNQRKTFLILLLLFLFLLVGIGGATFTYIRMYAGSGSSIGSKCD